MDRHQKSDGYAAWEIHPVMKMHYDPVTMNLCEILSDAIWFWVLQAGLVLFAAFALFQNRKRRHRGDLTMLIKRGAESMQYFLVICGLIIALPVAICASVDVPLVKGHRVLWILFDGTVVGTSASATGGSAMMFSSRLFTTSARLKKGSAEGTGGPKERTGLHAWAAFRLNLVSGYRAVFDSP